MNNPKPLELPSLDAVTSKIETCEEMETHLTNCKHEINTFLFKWLPDSATVRDLEQVSCAIFFEIHRRWEESLKAGKG